MLRPTDPHYERNVQILKAHPEIRGLYGSDIVTFWYFAAIFVGHALLAYASSSNMYVAVLAALFLGSFLDLGILVLLHELSHHLVFKTPILNNFLGIVANMPLIFPIACVFNQHHKAHHNFLGDPRGDVDVPLDIEVRLVGKSTIRKFIWLVFSGFILSARSIIKLGVKTSKLLYVNWVSSIGFGFFTLFWNPNIFAYFMISSLCTLSLHPSNARIIQRHVNPDLNIEGSRDFKSKNPAKASSQIPYVHTFSYYGPWNPFTLNVGYHVEHHDFPRIPWRKLPVVREIASEFYQELPFHTTRGLGDLVEFVFNKNSSLIQLS